jgi:antitoxin (DNA-binding transcriptional repressor) of toxin-antitoxin stability system
MTALSHRTGGRISAEDAAAHLAELLEHVREGVSYTITGADGRAVAKLEPAPSEPTDEERERAWQQLLARLESQPAMNAPAWTREELYAR